MKRAAKSSIRKPARKRVVTKTASKRQARKSIPSNRPEKGADLSQPLSFVGLVFANVTRTGQVIAAGVVRAQPNSEICLCQPITETGALGSEMYLLELEAMIDDQKSQESFSFFADLAAYQSWRQAKQARGSDSESE